MLHNKSTLILAGLAAAMYFLYTKLNKEDKKEVLRTVSKQAGELATKQIAAS